MLGVEVLANRYRLLDRLGEGGMSVVWRAVDEVLDRHVAVKVLGPRFAGDAMSRARVLYEARAAGRLNHPYVTAVYDYGESVHASGDRVPFVVMEIVPGGSLAQRVAQGPLPVPQALRICAQVASALAAAHARGLVHRDIKPGNVMLAPGAAKLVDFGLAAVAGDRADHGDGPFLGTPAYLAPERLCGDTVVPGSDVYALGLLLYQLLTGRLPWHSDTTTQMLRAHVYLDPAPLPRLTAVPSSIATLVHRCLAKDPDDRPTSDEVAAALASAAGIRVPLESGDPDEAAMAVPEEAVAAAEEAVAGEAVVGEAGSGAEAAMAGGAVADPEAAVAGEAVAGSPAPDVAVAAAGTTPPHVVVGRAAVAGRVASDVAVGRAAVARPVADGPYAERLARAIDPALDHVELRRRASALLRPTVDFDLALWVVLDPATLMWASCLVDGGPYDERFEYELFVNEYGQDDVLKIADLAGGPRLDVLSARTYGHPGSSRRFRTVLEPRGLADELRAVFHDGDQAWGALLLYRAGDHFTEADLAELEPAVPVFAAALHRSLEWPDVESTALITPPNRPPRMRWGRRRRQEPPPAAGTARPRVGTVVLTPDGSLLDADDEARALLDSDDLGMLINAVAEGRVSGVVDPGSGPRRGGRHLVFVASTGGAKTTVTVQLIRPHRMGEHVAAALGLSDSQRHVLQSVARGHSDRGIADDLGTSVYAVHDELVSLFEVFGVDGRPKLVQELFFDYYLPLHAADTRIAAERVPADLR
jgi:DNA-binding CsgD family transcriptional regulator